MVKHSKRQTRKNAALHSQLFQEQALRWTSQLSGWNWEISAGNRNWMVKTYGFQIPGFLKKTNLVIDATCGVNVGLPRFLLKSR